MIKLLNKRQTGLSRYFIPILTQMTTFFKKIRGGAPLPSRPSIWHTLQGLIGGAIGISVVAYLSHLTATPLLIAPLGATCVLLFAVPDAPLAQPRNVIAGHFLSSLVGLIFLNYFGTGTLEMGLAVGCAIALMQFTRTVHPPAGADPLVIMLGGTASWQFLLTPVLASTILLVLIALVVNNVDKERHWPKYW